MVGIFAETNIHIMCILEPIAYGIQQEDCGSCLITIYKWIELAGNQFRAPVNPMSKERNSIGPGHMIAHQISHLLSSCQVATHTTIEIFILSKIIISNQCVVYDYLLVDRYTSGTIWQYRHHWSANEKLIFSYHLAISSIFHRILIVSFRFLFCFQFLDIGIVTSVEVNHKSVESARKGQEVCLKIEPIPGESPKMFGRHFDEKDILVSKVSCIQIWQFCWWLETNGKRI